MGDDNGVEQVSHIREMRIVQRIGVHFPAAVVVQRQHGYILHMFDQMVFYDTAVGSTVRASPLIEEKKALSVRLTSVSMLRNSVAKRLTRRL